jgi:hypothetical protein
VRGLIGFVALLAVLAAGLFVYRSHLTGSGDVTQGTGNVRAAADVVGVKTDLMAIAQAERAHLALKGRYASLDELHASGELVVDPRRVRQGYTYSADIGDRTFTVTANYKGPADMPTLSIDESLQISQR